MRKREIFVNYQSVVTYCAILGLALSAECCVPGEISVSYGEGDSQSWSDSATNSADDSNSESSNPFVTNVSIEYLKSLYQSASLLITDDLAITGRITANDQFGEYPSSIVVEDSSGAIEIKCDLDCTTYGYIVGGIIQVLCSGLWLGSTSGMLALGGAPYDQVATAELSQEQMLQCAAVVSSQCELPTPTVATISSLTQNHILRYVVMNNMSILQSDDSPITFCSRDPQTGLTQYTTHTLIDLQGNTITLTVDRNVVYADEDLPTQLQSYYGIIEYFNGEYLFRIVNCGY